MVILGPDRFNFDSSNPAVQDVQVTIDTLVPPEVRALWRAVLGYREKGDEDLLDPHSRGPSFWFQEMDAPRPQRNRIYVDIYVPHDEAEARVAAAIAAGGHLVTDRHARGGSWPTPRATRPAWPAGWVATERPCAPAAVWRKARSGGHTQSTELGMDCFTDAGRTRGVELIARFVR